MIEMAVVELAESVKLLVISNNTDTADMYRSVS